MVTYKTPDVPDAIRAIRHPLYRNIYEYGLGNRNLWGTESLLGDWDGKYLLIAKDFYPASYIEKSTDPEPYRHNPSAPTNRNLLKTLRYFSQYGEGTSNVNCGFLYVSACFLLRADGVIRGPLPDETAVLELSRPVLEFTIDHMPNLSDIVLMGTEAARAMSQRSLRALIERQNYKVHIVSHPSRAMTDDDRFAQWSTVFNGR